MKKFIFYAFALVAGAFAFTSCDKEEDALTIASSQITATAIGGEQTISFTTNNAWEMVSSADWVTVNPASGEKGPATVKVSVAPNSTFENREAKLTLTAGTVVTEWVVKQSFVEVFGSSSTIDVTAAAQTIAIKVTTNQAYDVAVDADWVKVIRSKAAPVENSVVLELKANTAVVSRSAAVTISAADGSKSVYTLTQAPSESALEPVAVKYLGSAADPFNQEENLINNFHQWYLLFNSVKGQVAVALNAEADSFAGEFEVDAAASHANNTFSLNSNDSYVKYYTKIVENGNEISVVDGLVEVEENAGVYNISLQFLDDNNNKYSYVYNGTLPETEIENLGAEASASFGGDYYTYFANGAQTYSITLYTSGASAEGENNVFALCTDIAAVKTATGTALECGTYTYNTECEIVESGYANGNYQYQINSIYKLYGYSDFNQANYEENLKHENDYDWEELPYITQIMVNPGSEGTLTISKGDVEGTYNFAYDLTLVPYTSSYDDDWNEVFEYGEPFSYSYTFENVNVTLTDNHVAPVLDGDHEFSYAFPNQNYMGWSYGDSYNNGGNVFIIAYSTGVDSEYAIYIPLQSNGEWSFVKNFNNRFCSTPVPDGTYVYAATADDAVDADGAPLNIIPNIKTTARKYVKNGYTGTIAYISGGSVTLSNGNISFDLIAKTANGDEYHYTGGFASTCYYLQDYSAANRQTQVAWAE